MRMHNRLMIVIMIHYDLHYVILSYIGLCQFTYGQFVTSVNVKGLAMDIKLGRGMVL